jgi:hypothetical protein
MVEKQAHAFHHEKDPHCLATDKHFHSVEHNCSICDFTSAESPELSTVDFTFLISGTKFSYCAFIENATDLKPYHLLPSRAPPIV